MFGFNQVTLVGRVGQDPEPRMTNGGSKVLNFSIATDESYIDRNTGDVVPRTEWHNIVAFQNGETGLVDSIARNASKGRLMLVTGSLQTRRWRADGEQTDRFRTEIRITPGSRVSYLDPRPGANGQRQARPAATHQRPQRQAAPAPATVDSPPDWIDEEIPF